MLKRIRMTISGKVQGIFLRSYIQDHARHLNLKGYVKNLPTREVEALFEGQKEDIDKMLNTCKRGPPLSQIKNINIKEEKPTKEFTDFKIIR